MNSARKIRSPLEAEFNGLSGVNSGLNLRKKFENRILAGANLTILGLFRIARN